MSHVLKRLSWVPVVALVVAMLVLWGADVRVAHYSPVYNWLMHYGTGAIGIAFIVVPAARSLLAKGQPSVLMLGSGVLMTQLGAALMPIGFSRSASVAFAIYNTAILLSGLCYLGGVAIVSRHKVEVKHPWRWLTAAYVGCVAAMGLVLWLALTGKMPAFFVDGVGGTTLRTVVVTTAAALFLLTAFLMWWPGRARLSSFVHWYALGLILLAAGLMGSMAVVVIDAPLHWLTRSTQALGMLYMVMAVMESARQTGVWKMPADFTLDEAGPQFEMLFQLSGDGIVVHEMKGRGELGNFIQVNGTVCDMLGYSREEMLRLSPLDVMDPSEHATITRDRERMLEQGVLRHDKTLLGKDGRKVYVEMSSRMFEHHGRQMVTTMIRDVSERRHVEDALRNSEERYRNLFNSIDEGFCIIQMVFNAEGKPVDFRFLEVNAAFEKQTGLHGAEGKLMLELAPAHEAHWFETYGKIALTGEPLHVLNEAKALNRYYDVYAYRVGRPEDGQVAILFNDISEYKRTQEELQQAKEEWERTFDSVPDLIAILDDKHKVVRANQAMANRLGVTPEQCVGLECYKVVHGTNRPPAFCPHARTLADGQEHSIQVHEEKLGGEFLVSTTPLVGAEGKMMGSVHVARDITQRKRAEEKLEALNATLSQRVKERTAELELRATQLQRLAAELTNAEDRERERLAGFLHDDLQQHLAAMKLRASMLVADLIQPEAVEQAEEFTRMIDESIAKTRTLSHELAPPTPKSSGVASALEWLAEDMRQRYGLSITLEVDPQARLKSPVHASALVRAVRELLFNVHKHSGVHAAHVRVYRNDGEIHLSVRDKGVGFDPDTLQGTGATTPGIGLFAIMERIKLLGGRADVDSSTGNGCCVSLYMPASEHLLEAPSPAPAARLKRGSGRHETDGKIRVLLVDDQAVMREGLASLLTSAGFQVAGQAASGREAIELTEVLIPDVILMDVSMAGMDGIEATGVIASRFPDVRVIGLSMHDDAGTSARMLHAGAWCYLCKTGPADDLLNAIRGQHPLDRS